MTKKYCIRGGAIGFILLLIFFLLNSFLPAWAYGNIEGGFNHFMNFFPLSFTLEIVFGLLPGALLGWLYGKHKSKIN